MKDEPEWMLDFRLKALKLFYKMPMPQWGGDLSELDFDDITYYVKPSEHTERSWDEVPEEIKRTFDKLGIPEAEQKYLAGVSAQYESEVVYHNMEKELEEKVSSSKTQIVHYVRMKIYSVNISLQLFQLLTTNLRH